MRRGPVDIAVVAPERPMTTSSSSTRTRRPAELLLAACMALLAVVGVQLPAQAANPHFVRTTATLNGPLIVDDPQIGFGAVWVTDATLTFQLAGLGANRGVTVTADAVLRFAAATASCESEDVPLALSAIVLSEDKTFTSDRNGVVKGQIVLHQELIAIALTSLPPSETCGVGLRVAYKGLTLTVDGTPVQAQLGTLTGSIVRGSVTEADLPPLP